MSSTAWTSLRATKRGYMTGLEPCRTSVPNGRDEAVGIHDSLVCTWDIPWDPSVPSSIERTLFNEPLPHWDYAPYMGQKGIPKLQWTVVGKVAWTSLYQSSEELPDNANAFL